MLTVRTATISRRSWQRRRFKIDEGVLAFWPTNARVVNPDFFCLWNHYIHNHILKDGVAMYDIVLVKEGSCLITNLKTATRNQFNGLTSKKAWP